MDRGSALQRKLEQEQRDNGVVDLKLLFTETVERNYRGGGNTLADVIGQDSCWAVWQAFHEWSKEQIDEGNCVYIKGFAVIGYEISREGVRILNIKLLENFLGDHHLALEPGERERMA